MRQPPDTSAGGCQRLVDGLKSSSKGEVKVTLVVKDHLFKYNGSFNVSVHP